MTQSSSTGAPTTMGDISRDASASAVSVHTELSIHDGAVTTKAFKSYSSLASVIVTCCAPSVVSRQKHSKSMCACPKMSLSAMVQLGKSLLIA